MKKQANLLGFLQKVSTEIPKSTSHIKSTDAGSTKFVVPAGNSSVLEESSSFIIPGTPETSRCNPLPFLSSPRLSARPALTPINLNPGTSTPVTNRKQTIHKRSSLTARRQAELLEKHSLQLLPDIGISNESEQMRTNRQANAAAKLRRGNYDELNYAPIDQVNISAQSSEPKPTFSRRSHLLVSKAITTSNKRVSESSPAKSSAKRVCLEEDISANNSILPLDRKAKTKVMKSDPPSNAVVRLDTSENIALNDILASLENTSKNTAPILNHCLTNPSSCRSSTSPGTSPHKGCDGRFSVAKPSVSNELTDLNEQQFGMNDSMGQLDLSDWSLEEQPLVSASSNLEDSHKLDSTSPLPTLPFYRGIVKNLAYSRNRIQLSLLLAESCLPSSDNCETGAGRSFNVDLMDSWTDSEMQVGDMVHIVPTVGDCHAHGENFRLDDRDPPSTDSSSDHIPTVLIQHPNILVSGTKLVSSFYCERRTVIEEFWLPFEEAVDETKRADGYSPPGRVMLIGSIVHELLQKLIVKAKPTKDAADKLVSSILHRPDTILQMYACGLTLDEMRSSLDSYVEKTLRWIGQNRCDPNSGICISSSCAPTHPLVHEVVDVEENFWSTKLGIKGRIDLSVVGHLPQLTRAGKERKNLSLIPIELKTGRPSYSMEHKGQVLLYLMMLLDRYGRTYKTETAQVIPTASAGWLVYLQDESITTKRPHPGLVAPQADSFRGLIQTRNRLVTQMWKLISSLVKWDVSDTTSWTPPLPKPTKQLRSCQFCPVQMACSLFEAPSTASPANRNSCHPLLDAEDFKTVPELLASKRAHLTPAHLRFFVHWCTLLLLEYANSDRLDTVIGRIVSSKPPSLKTSSDNGAVRRLKVCASFRVSDQWQTVLVPEQKSSERSEAYLGVGEFVIVSSDDNHHVGLMLGTTIPLTIEVWQKLDSAVQLMLSPDGLFSARANCIVLQTDRVLPAWVDRYRLDRYISSKALQLNLSNMVGFMQQNTVGGYLRSLIIDGTKPTFTATLSKQVVTSIRGILKHLNTCQKMAILRVLMANHYVLIKGYPGTGKTETLVSLLRVLLRMKQKVLVVAHTHSAVDNLLTRLLKSGEQKILRLGSTDRVTPALLEYTFEYMLDQQTKKTRAAADPIVFIRQCLENASVVGCTALAASGGSGAQHAALCRTRFDLILVDEASQLLLPTCIGALLCLRSTDSSTECKSRFVLVGDPYQLPPLVQSDEARKAGLDRSLFNHLLSMNEPESIPTIMNKSGCVVALNLQYRMNSPILRLANELTYSNVMKAVDASVANGTLADRLTNSVGQIFLDSEINTIPMWLTRSLSARLEDATLFLDTSQWHSLQENRDRDYKFSNPTEAKLIVFLLRLLVKRGLGTEDVSIIAPHRSQVSLLRQLLGETPTFGVDGRVLSDVEVNTVDQFQGRDKRAIILSLTVCRHNRMQTIHSAEEGCSRPRTALLEDPARLAVALTRAKHKLLIIGCSGLESGAPATAIQNNGTLDKLFTLMNELRAWEILKPEDQAFLQGVQFS